jgi:hypothetical protein
VPRFDTDLTNYTLATVNTNTVDLNKGASNSSKIPKDFNLGYTLEPGECKFIKY